MPATASDATEVAASSGAQQGPPATIEFVSSAQRLVRYNSMARSGDTDAAVLGKGGFGCVYRYAIDASFTPPSSMDLSLCLRSATTRRQTYGLESSPPTGLYRLESSQKPPPLVAVKLCRTPCSGSFDELQKTSLVDKKTRRAEMQDDRKMHVRIVRGEGRIFQYLQAARQVSNRSTDPPLVKLLANLSPNGTQNDPYTLDDVDISVDEEDGPPTRLLVFEKLIELDAEHTPRGWIKSKKPWSHERVEKVAFEVMQGLQFLHEHNVTHGDLKPSNLMLDPRTGIVKIIDLGASRRFVYLSNRERNNRSAVEEQDRRALSRGRAVERLRPELCEGLGSLTGSPYYMAPEILLQATRYVDASGRARSVLEDYEYDYPSFLAREQWPMYQIGLSDLRRGWGIRADIWSWACTVQALLLKTVEEDQRPSSSIISPYDFSFSRHRDEMIEPLYEKASGEDDVPRFHQWCRVLPLLIVRVALESVPLIPQADGCSAALRSALKASLRHQDLRPIADELLESLQASRPAPPRLNRISPSSHTANSSRLSHGELKRQSLLGTPSDMSASPQMSGSDLEGSRYTTPTLSRGASIVSTPQHTCENGSKSSMRSTPDGDRKNKVRFEASSADSAFFRAPSPPERHLSVESSPVPQGFELVSPTRTPKMRSTTLGEAPRPATANAGVSSFRAASVTAPTSRARRAGTAQASRSHPSTPTSSLRDLAKSRPGTSPQTVAKDLSLGVQETPLRQSQQQSALHLDPRRVLDSGSGLTQSPVSFHLPSPGSAGGLGISWPLDGIHSLQLSSPAQEARGDHVSNVPCSPITHARGASVPLLATDRYGQVGNQIHSAVSAASRNALTDGNVAGSPQRSLAEGKNGKHTSLMATLKEKQVRLRQSSRKLMSKRGSGPGSSLQNSRAEAVSDEPGTGSNQNNGARYVFGHRGGESEAYAASSGGQQANTTAIGNLNRGHDAMLQTPGMSCRERPDESSTLGHGSGAANRRAGNKSVSEASPSKPLLKRLLTWSTTS